jgi:adenylyltransferase/sulfurtransferase
MILPEWGKEGQLTVKSTSVLIVGCGGLGCPAAQYLAAAGIGHIGLVDYDTVELGNLHRQVLHSEKGIGEQKATSVAESLKSLNSNVTYTTHHLLLDNKNALQIIKEYDIIVDCTDNVATRYLLNDSCVLLKKPLVSGSALRFEGQLTVYNYKGGPCYRCIFPSPPPPQTVTNCSEGGVLGVVPGIIGSLQALEVLKISSKIGECHSQKLLLFDGLSGRFRSIQLRGRRHDCAVCGDNPTITELIDYPVFCGSCPDDKGLTVDVLEQKDRMTCEEYKALVDSGSPHVLVDVREEVQYSICSLPHSINIPISAIGGPTEQEKVAVEVPKLHRCLERMVASGSDGEQNLKGAY